MTQVVEKATKPIYRGLTLQPENKTTMVHFLEGHVPAILLTEEHPDLEDFFDNPNYAVLFIEGTREYVIAHDKQTLERILKNIQGESVFHTISKHNKDFITIPTKPYIDYTMMRTLGIPDSASNYLDENLSFLRDHEMVMISLWGIQFPYVNDKDYIDSVIMEALRFNAPKHLENPEEHIFVDGKQYQYVPKER